MRVLFNFGMWVNGGYRKKGYTYSSKKHKSALIYVMPDLMAVLRAVQTGPKSI
jgi:hypothetical protein